MTPETPRVAPRLLLVDDMLHQTAELAAALRDDGYHVDTAETATEAVHSVRRVSYSAVLLDIELPLGEAAPTVFGDDVAPERAGIHVLRHMRYELGLLELPVIVLSGLDHQAFWPTVERELLSPGLGAIAVVKKPASLRDILWNLARATGWRGPLYEAHVTQRPGH